MSLTGDDAQDTAAVQAEMAAISEFFDPEEETLSAASCDTGEVGEYRRAKTIFRAIRPEAYVKTLVYDHRITCTKWEIYRVETKLVDDPIHRVYWRYFWYSKAQFGDSRYGRLYWNAGCRQLHRSDYESISPDWTIRVGYKAMVEVIDDEFGDTHCTGSGNSYTSGWFRLRGASS